MGRIARRCTVEVNSVNHCSWRGHNHAFVLGTDEEKQKFLDLLGELKKKYGVLILSYCVMDSHPHVICVATQGQKAFSAFWQVVNYRYARWYNQRHQRRGQVVMERLSSPQIQTDRHLLNALRYVDANPVRAGLARSAKDWRWSSHRHYALGRSDPLIDDAPAFVDLGSTPVERRLAYRHLFSRRQLEPFLVKRPDLVRKPFVGDDWWVSARARDAVREASG